MSRVGNIEVAFLRKVEVVVSKIVKTEIIPLCHNWRSVFILLFQNKDELDPRNQEL